MCCATEIVVLPVYCVRENTLVKKQKPHLQISSREGFGGGLGFKHAQGRVHPQGLENISNQSSHDFSVVTVMKLARKPVWNRLRGVLFGKVVEDLCFIFCL